MTDSPSLSGAPVLVTGATGFTGSRLAEHLATREGAIVTGLGRDLARVAGLRDQGVELVEMDFPVPPTLRSSSPDTSDASDASDAAYGEAMGALFELIVGFIRGHVLRTGLELGLFEALGSEPQAAAEIASGLDLEPGRTNRLLRAMAQTVFVTEESGEAFPLVPLGRYLEDDHPATLRALQ